MNRTRSIVALCCTFGFLRLTSTCAVFVPTTSARPTSNISLLKRLVVDKHSNMVQTRRGLQTEIQAKIPSKVPSKARKSISKPSATPKTPPPPQSSGKAKSSPSPTKSPKPPPAKSRLVNGKRLLFSLRDDDELLEATLVSRPSKRNKSPYVGDIQVVSKNNNDNDGNTPLQTPNPLVHLPNLDMGGKCRPGVKVLVKPSRDRKGRKISATATGKYGTPKCQFSSQLLWVNESAYGQLSDNDNDKDVSVKDNTSISKTLYPPVWVGAHPSLGERIAEVWLREGLIAGIPPRYKTRTSSHPPR